MENVILSTLDNKDYNLLSKVLSNAKRTLTEEYQKDLVELVQDKILGYHKRHLTMSFEHWAICMCFVKAYKNHVDENSPKVFIAPMGADMERFEKITPIANLREAEALDKHLFTSFVLSMPDGYTFATGSLEKTEEEYVVFRELMNAQFDRAVEYVNQVFGTHFRSR